MEKRKSHTRRADRAFTRLELAVVLATLGLLAAITLPVLAGSRTHSEQANDPTSAARAVLELWGACPVLAPRGVLGRLGLRGWCPSLARLALRSPLRLRTRCADRLRGPKSAARREVSCTVDRS